MKISLIIPFYNARSYLDILCEALQSQTLSEEKFEIIFVDNNSSDNSVEIINESFQASQNRFTFRILEYKARASSYGARNIGVNASNGDVLVFTDADCEPKKDWLSNIMDAFERTPTLDVISGFVDLKVLNPNNPWELYDKEFHMDNERNLARGRIVTANLSVRKECFLSIGYFDEVESGGDFNWSRKIKLNNKKMNFIKGIIVLHPTRKTEVEILTKLKRLVRGEAEIAVKSNQVLNKSLKAMLRPMNVFIYKRILSTIENSEMSKIMQLQFILCVAKLKIIQMIEFYKSLLNNMFRK